MMQVFNVMEELVLEMVHEIFEEKRGKGFPLVDCEQCRLDVACYVLNRIEPEYLISGRGVVHVQNELRQNFQKRADIVSLVNEGIRIITQNQRPYYEAHEDESAKEEGISRGPYFNFPAIIGTILNGKTFEPAENLNVFLFQDGKPVSMIDRSWPNPYFIVRSTRGSFSFWPRPIKASRENEKKNVNLEIRAEAEGFQPIRHFIDIQLTAVQAYCTTFSMERSLKVGNLYFFTKASEEEQRELGVEDL
ncbi:late competence development ComFB family protein [Sediminispirochaeta smaragdinae]|nr:late competence development ComFB family protein [Sediminispirochaeta smaragdinae]